MSLETVRKLLNVNSDVEATIYAMVSNRLDKKLSVGLADTTQALIDLEYIIDEVTIKRFNRVGSEGMESESVEGHSIKFNSTDDFLEFETDIANYIASQAEPTTKGVVRFL